MKSKLLIVALISILMIAGMFLMSCVTCPGFAGRNIGGCNGNTYTPDCDNLCIRGQTLASDSNLMCNCF